MVLKGPRVPKLNQPHGVQVSPGNEKAVLGVCIFPTSGVPGAELWQMGNTGRKGYGEYGEHILVIRAGEFLRVTCWGWTTSIIVQSTFI